MQCLIILDRDIDKFRKSKRLLFYPNSALPFSLSFLI